MRIASYRNSTISVFIPVQEALSAFAGSASSLYKSADYINFLTNNAKPIVRWGRKATPTILSGPRLPFKWFKGNVGEGSMDVIMDSLAAEVNRVISIWIIPISVQAAPAFRPLFGRVEKGERNEQTYR